MFTAIFAVVGVIFMSHGIDSSILKMGVAGEWKTLNPGLQHTVFGDLVLSNQFDPLVGYLRTGVPSPLGAISWEISDDFKIYTFKIDQNRRFSDGTYLSSIDYKRSWEQALKLDPSSHNSSLADVLYKIEGYEDFQKVGSVSGIETPDSGTLRVRFKTPFRMALEYLAGIRYAAFKEFKDQKFIGTGEYVIEERSDGKLLLDPNPYSGRVSQLNRILLSVVPPDHLLTAFRDGEIDVWAYGPGSKVPSEILNDSRLTVIPGQEAAHQTIAVNGLPGRTLSSKGLRKALQCLLIQSLRSKGLAPYPVQFYRLDPQVFLDFQPGRLSLDDADQIILDGCRELESLKNKSLSHPLVLYSVQKESWVKKELEQAGIRVSDKSKVIPTEKHFEMIYKTNEYDLYFTDVFSVGSGDPDGIYHALGKNGAILNPVTFRASIDVLLERGRELLGQEKLHEQYQAVSREILEEVPFIHMGFIRAVSVYRNDKVSFDESSLRRNEGHFHAYRLK